MQAGGLLAPVGRAPQGTRLELTESSPRAVQDP
jgi:hypothetical protein